MLLAAAVGWLAATWSDRPTPPPLAVAVRPRWSFARSVLLAAGVSLALLPACARPGGTLPELVRFGTDLGRSGNTVDPAGGLIWLLGVTLTAAALWRRPGPNAAGSARRPRLGELVAFAAVAGAAAWFRFAWLGTIPPEMISDHAEKLLDVRDVLAGWRPAFFAQNGGREPLQFYLTAVLVRAGLPLGFMTLKTGMALVGLATVPAVLWLGCEAGGRRLGLLAAAVVAVMPWHLQVVRLGLRAPLSPLLAALGLAAMLRALRTGDHRWWIGCGLLTGIGLYGYTGFRPMPVAVAAAAAVALAVGRAPAAVRRGTATGVAAAMLVASAVVLPLLRVAVLDPGAFWARSLARVAPAGDAAPVPVARRLADGWVDTLLMMNRTRDPTWALNPAFRPALDPVGGGLLVLGLAAAAARALRRDWRWAALVAAGPAMLAASAMAIGFPGEIPHLARAAGAIPVVALLVALPLDRLLEAGRSGRGAVAIGATAALLAGMAAFSAHRLFADYPAGYAVRCQPVSLGAAAAREWIARGGAPERVVLVGWPHGWDWRALAYELGEPDWRRVLTGTGSDMRGAVEAVVADPEGTLVLLGGPRGGRDAAELVRRFPGGVARAHPGYAPERDFWSVEIPPRSPRHRPPAGPSPEADPP